MFNLSPDQIVLGLPPNDGDSDVIARTGIDFTDKKNLKHTILVFALV